MQVDLLIGPSALRWHAEVMRACERAGFRATAVTGAHGGAKIAGLDLLLAFERLIYRAPDGPLQPVRLDVRRKIASPFVVDLSGAAETKSNGSDGMTVLRPLYDGSPDPAAAVFALLDRRAPEICVELSDAQGVRIVAQGTIGIRDRRVLSHGLDETFTRATSLLVRALRDLRDGIRPAGVAPAPPMQASNSPFAFATAAFAEKIIANVLTQMSVRPRHWRVALRRLHGDDMMERLQWPLAPWTVLPDDGKRYYADPFVIDRGGRTHLFVEEFPYSTRKGVISHALIEADGRIGAPRPVLEAAGHLSYPFVFERDGQVYMIPESSAERRIALYRADQFPARWTLDCVLVDDIDASDATLVEQEGRFWLFAALSEGGSSSWDALGLFYADDLRGPWRAHPRNPVLVDARAARPGGSIVAQGGGLRRVAQDCSLGYGSGMTICRIDRLDPENYEQSVLARLAPPKDLGERAAHTLNRCAEFEVIDFQAPLARRGLGWILAKPAFALAG